ncbi:MAG: hypothetical protein AAF657_02760 [Acidobacteriota bacterium]
MAKKWIWMLALVGCTVFAGLAIAEGGMPSEADHELDMEALKRMAPAERIAAQQSYKDKLEAAARANGWRPGNRRPFTPVGRQAGTPIDAAGSITYHSGVLGTCCTNGFTVGNQFNSAITTGGTMIGPVEMSGSVTMATFDLVAVSAPNVFLSFYHNRAGTTAPRIGGSILTTGVTGLNTKTVAISYSGSTFIAGIWNFNGDSPAVATGSVGGQGFHGVSLDDGAGGMSIMDLAGTNAAMSVIGNVLTPVELMSFEID